MDVGETTAVVVMALALSLPGHALSVLAGRPARSGRSAALRVSTMAERETPVVFLHAIERRYRQGDATLDILKGADLAVWPGQIGRADRAVGRRQIDAACTSPVCSSTRTPARSISTRSPTSALTDAERTRIRRTEIGFIYQAHHLLPEFTAVENVMLPQMIRGLRKREAQLRATELLSYLGPEGASDAPAGGTVRRRAAARGDRARRRQCAADSARRRADRQSRSAHVRARLQRA